MKIWCNKNRNVIHRFMIYLTIHLTHLTLSRSQLYNKFPSKRYIVCRKIVSFLSGHESRVIEGRVARSYARFYGQKYISHQKLNTVIDLYIHTCVHTYLHTCIRTTHTYVHWRTFTRAHARTLNEYLPEVASSYRKNPNFGAEEQHKSIVLELKLRNERIVAARTAQVSLQAARFR